MSEEHRYCIDILHQIASFKSAANSLALTLLRDHLKRYLDESDAGSADEKLDEVIEAVRRCNRT